LNIGTRHLALLVTTIGDSGLVQPHRICTDGSLLLLRRGLEEKVFYRRFMAIFKDNLMFF